MSEILRIENLHKRFGDLEVLKGIDVTVESGETIVVLGSSGSGKSTLLRCVNFMEMPTEGRVYLHGELIGSERGGRVTYRERDLCALRTRIGMVFQHFNLFPHMTVLQNVMEGPVTVLKRDREQARDDAMVQLVRVGLADKAVEYPRAPVRGSEAACRHRPGAGHGPGCHALRRGDVGPSTRSSWARCSSRCGSSPKKA